MNTCKNCDTALIGRTDKKYCNDLCKSRFHNKANKETNTGGFDKNEMTNKRNSVADWIFSQLPYEYKTTRSGFDVYQQAKAMEKEEHGKTWDASMDNYKARGGNYVRAYGDFDDYYNEKFKGKNNE